ncbi:MAG: LysR family transcriptional regulator [Acidimicrobiales bacterium]
MDMVLLRSFLAVADAGTITEAADDVDISQSALSRRLQQLEAELGATLLLRGRHGVELTEVGRDAVEAARAIVARYDRLRQNISEHLGLERGTVRIGGGATVTSYVLPPLIAEFQSAHPGVRFQVKEAGSREIASDVSAGVIEIGVVTLPVPSHDLEVSELFTDEIVLVCRADHAFASRRVAVTDLEDQPFVAFEPGSAIRQIIDNSLRAAGVQIDVVMELRSIPSILRMVATTGHLAFVSRVSLHSEPELRAVPIEGFTISRSLGLVTRQGIPLSAPAAAFSELLRR